MDISKTKTKAVVILARFLFQLHFMRESRNCEQTYNSPGILCIGVVHCPISVILLVMVTIKSY